MKNRNEYFLAREVGGKSIKVTLPYNTRIYKKKIGDINFFIYDANIIEYPKLISHRRMWIDIEISSGLCITAICGHRTVKECFKAVEKYLKDKDENIIKDAIGSGISFYSNAEVMTLDEFKLKYR